MATSGTITTFNFAPSSGTTHLASQRYSVCIAQKPGNRTTLSKLYMRKRNAVNFHCFATLVE